MVGEGSISYSLPIPHVQKGSSVAPPIAPQNFRVLNIYAGIQFPCLVFAWDEAGPWKNDRPNIERYIVKRDGEIVNATRAQILTDWFSPSGPATYGVVAMNKESEESPLSNTVVAQQPE